MERAYPNLKSLDRMNASVVMLFTVLHLRGRSRWRLPCVDYRLLVICFRSKEVIRSYSEKMDCADAKIPLKKKSKTGTRFVAHTGARITVIQYRRCHFTFVSYRKLEPIRHEAWVTAVQEERKTGSDHRPETGDLPSTVVCCALIILPWIRLSLLTNFIKR